MRRNPFHICLYITNDEQKMTSNDESFPGQWPSNDGDMMMAAGQVLNFKFLG